MKKKYKKQKYLKNPTPKVIYQNGKYQKNTKVQWYINSVYIKKIQKWI